MMGRKKCQNTSLLYMKVVQENLLKAVEKWGRGGGEKREQ
jgi:hypothetical protein